MKLTRRQRLHVRMVGGAFYTYDMLLDGEVVGTMTVRINKRVNPWTDSTSYAIGDKTFESLRDFKAAVAEMKRNKP